MQNKVDIRIYEKPIAVEIQQILEKMWKKVEKYKRI